MKHQASPADGFRVVREDGGSVVDVALLVSRVVQPDTDVDWCRAELRRLAEATPAVEGATPGAGDLVDALRSAGFTGARSGYYEARNSSLEYVLRERRGIPISLAAVVIGTAECLGFKAAGVNFPRHFLVAVEDTLIDPFEMELTSEEHWRDWLRREMRSATGEGPAQSELDAAFRRAGPVDIALRMLNNLRMLPDVRNNPEYALTLNDCLLALQPDASALHVDRADIWLALRSLDRARHELQTALELAGDNARKSIRARLNALPDGSGTAH